jgi:2-furoate---CoA ligase
MNLGTLFEFAVSRYRDIVALVDLERSCTFLELNREVDRLADALVKLGIGNRDRVMVLMRNRWEEVCLFWALQKIGAIFTPINYRMSRRDIQYCITDVEPKAIVYDDVSASLVSSVDIDARSLLISIESGDGDITYQELIEKGNDDFQTVAVDENDIAIMLYTSGTSGVPKGVPRSHRNEYASTLAHIIQNQYEPNESMLGAMPLYHTMGIRSLLSMTILGGKYVLSPEFNVEDTLRLLSNERVSCLYMIPTMYHELLKYRRIEDFELSHLRKLGYAGAPMSNSLIDECFRILKPKLFVNHYGSTEVYTITTCSRLDKKPGCAGQPGINQRIKLVSMGTNVGEEEEEVEFEPGQIGQIIVHAASPEAFKGYWNRPEMTREVLHGDWYFTGDLGVLDDEGDLYVIGRVDEMVICGGHHVSPHKVEEVLTQHPMVREAAVVGEADERWGQIVVAYIVAKDRDLTELELDRHCKYRGALSQFERPKKYVFIEELPKGPTGKVLRRNLIANHWPKA